MPHNLRRAHFGKDRRGFWGRGNPLASITEYRPLTTYARLRTDSIALFGIKGTQNP
jgi:hypothetical protein